MTIPINDEEIQFGETNEDSQYLSETIKCMLSQPSESFEKFQNSFILTKPHQFLQPHSHEKETSLEEHQHHFEVTNRSNSSVSSVNEEVAHLADDFQDILLPDDHVTQTRILNIECPAPLPKVDNFVAEEETELPWLHLNNEDGNAVSSNDDASHGITLNNISEVAPKSNFKVEIINVVSDDDAIPGEVSTDEFVDNIDDKPQSTILPLEHGYSGNIANSEDNSCINDNVGCSDLVEPFEIDDDFDYDNVKLTPKYSGIAFRTS